MFKKLTEIFSVVLFCAVASQAATVSGTVQENDSTGVAISGATVTLTPTGGGNGVTATTDATGAFTFTNVGGTAAAPVTYRITAAKTGYRVMTNVVRITVIAAGATYTQKLYLVATGTVGLHTVSGTVSDSVASSALTALDSARVILTQAAIGGGAPAIDTVITGAAGTYTFDSVAVGQYTITVSKLGYATQTANIIVATGNIVQNFKMLHVVTASITGTVTDSATTTGIVGAKVYLLTRGGGAAIIDSAVTTTGGAYTIATVPSSTAGINYTVRASMTDYVTSNVNVTVTGTAAQTVNFKLVAIAMASISGTVTDSITAVAPVAGVTVSLRTGGATIDSVITGSDGTYSFASVPSGVTYTIRATAAGFVTSNTNISITGTAAQTVNIRLVKTPTGNLYVVVKTRSTDSSAISGASVSATIGTTVLNTTTSASGLASFIGVATGNYAITVSAANFTAVNSNTTLGTNGLDTVRVYLVAAATKTLGGVVKDSVTSVALANVAVKLVIQGAGIGGGTLTLIDSTDANGNYSFVGIPVNRITGTLTATLADYRTFTDNAVAIGTINVADNNVENILLVKLPVAVSSVVNHASGSPTFSMSQKGMLRFNNISEAGSVKLFSMNGKLLYQTALSAHATSLTIPASVVRSGSSYIVSMTQANAVYRKQIMVP